MQPGTTKAAVPVGSTTGTAKSAVRSSSRGYGTVDADDVAVRKKLVEEATASLAGVTAPPLAVVVGEDEPGVPRRFRDPRITQRNAITHYL